MSIESARRRSPPRAPTSETWAAFPEGPAQPRRWMLITRYFVFLHVPKTGGEFIRKVCFDHLPREWLIRNALDTHTPYKHIAEEFADLPMFSLVRNPWDWYVSWYHFLTQTNPEQRAGGPMWITAFGSGGNAFRETVVNACTGQSFEHERTGPIVRELGVDHYSALHHLIAAQGIEAGRVEVGKFEALRQDFLDFLGRHDVPIERPFVAALRAEPPYGSSKRGPYQQYYDPELRDIVAEKADRIVTDYGYVF
jgi:hypothetical protein